MDNLVGRLFATGDTHGEHSINRLSNRKFKEAAHLTRQDHVIVCGDFGLIFNNVQTAPERHWTKWLNERPFTALFVDGNHDNHPKLNALPLVPMFGDFVGKVADNIYHLKRGKVYTINGKKIFTMGGAQSTDIAHRIDGISWWKEEVPSFKEFDDALTVLEQHGNEVDYIIGHNCPRTIARIYMAKHGWEDDTFKIDPVSRFFDTIIQFVKFKAFYFGHWHDDWTFGPYNMLYNKVVEIP